MAKKKNIDDYVKIEEKKDDKDHIDPKIEKINTKEENIINKIDIPKKKIYKHPFTNFILILTLLSSVVLFILGLLFDKANPMDALISGLLVVIFTLLFVMFSMTTNRKNKSLACIGSLFLLGYFVYGSLLTVGIVEFKNKNVINFTNMELTEVIKWSEKNKINIVQDYEYSDMISEYHIISQDVEPGTKLKEVESITVAVSEGPNPYKEIVIPNMVNWDSEQVLEFIKKNHLSNVNVEFVESNKDANTVIEQNKSGNMKRDEELKLVFSYGLEDVSKEIKLRDLSGMSKFEATFYLKQNRINYEFDEVFSSKVKRDFVVKQSVKAGTMINTGDAKITVSISKGPEIKIPNLKGMSMTAITEWVIKNKLKLEFTDKYDDTIDENSVISANYKEGEIVTEGTVIEVVVSRGKLVMPEFDSYYEFKEWADKYGILYEEQREFSDSVKAGDVISYSYKTGDTIRNNDPVVIVISSGKSVSVPSVTGLTKTDASNKLKNAGFGYSYVYSYSDSVAQGKVIRQSISAGSKVAQGTTITLTISNGPKPAAPSKPVTPTCDTSKGATFYVGLGNNGSQALSATKNQNPGFNIIANYVDQCPNGDTLSGAVCNSGSYDAKWISYCTTITLTIVK